MIFSTWGNFKRECSMANRSRGRPAGESGTQEAIIAAARAQFGERGFTSTTLRSIARAAGVDHRLVLHYFGSKDELFKAAVQLPIAPELVVERVFAGDDADVGRRAAELMITVLDDPQSRSAVLGLLRAAVTEPSAAQLIRDLLAERMLLPVARRVGGDRPELRASLVATSVIGLAVGRHVVGLAAMAGASRAEMVSALAPVIDHYLRGDWLPADDPASAGQEAAPTAPSATGGTEGRRQ
jgi:AcrR family transcriptional regulator